MAPEMKNMKDHTWEESKPRLSREQGNFYLFVIENIAEILHDDWCAMTRNLVEEEGDYISEYIKNEWRAQWIPYDDLAWTDKDRYQQNARNIFRQLEKYYLYLGVPIEPTHTTKEPTGHRKL